MMNLQEHLTADKYTDPEIRRKIAEEYVRRYTPIKSPLTDPLAYDPLNPPQGWLYDPYYELWINCVDNS
jgi:hypothetical protein